MRESSGREGFFESRSRRLCSSVSVFFLSGRLLLLPPAAEVGISPKHHLECGVHDVIWGALDECRVLLDRYGDWLLQLVLALHHLRRLIDDRHEFSFLSSSSLA